MTARTTARTTKMGMGIVAALLAASVYGVGYWMGHRQAPANADHEAAAQARKPLFYRNPMGLPDTSPTPKKDAMGMDYIPVYAGEQPDEAPGAAQQIKISTDKVQKLGVRTEAVQRKVLDRTLRAAGRVELDERRVYTIAAKFEGYVEKLHVNATGQAVRQGQTLFEVYSPELVSAQREYLLANQALKDASADNLPGLQPGMQQLADAGLARLKNWDISPEQLAQIKAAAAAGQTRRTLSVSSPVGGVVTEKKAVQGMRFAPGEVLYQVADLSTVWVMAEVFEQDIRWVKTGSRAKVHLSAYPDNVFEGPVTTIYPTLKAETRTVAVRIELSNPGGRLKPGMFAQVELGNATPRDVTLAVPISAVIDSGTRQIVLVQRGEGRYEPREVRLGVRNDKDVEVLSGVQDGEAVVVSANFLIDAESNLKAAISGFGHAAVGHHAQGKVEAIDAANKELSISHGPVASLHWPGMTMDFKVANEALLQGLQPGSAISFEFVERGPGEWVITAVQPTAHAGH
ncbi:MAG: efflux RND transporter periplasmic adaptor subunit [Leptothrix ochracea]|uniref:efflux RND transporter periplasmic adaptor subunit n=1 Tax=Leptothrix ochracea TaxID=735331 RepID=UPI0034E25382